MTRPTLYIEPVGSAGGTPAVILTHGMAEDCSTWRGVAAALAPSRRCVLWDLPGHGNSPEVDDVAGYTAQLGLESLAAVIETHGGSTPLVLAGHSLGGYLSCRYAIEHPERVAGLILVATGPGFRDEGARRRWNDDVRATAERIGRPSSLLGLHDDAFVMEHLTAISCPVLLLVGSRDKAFLGATDYYERKLADVRRYTIEDAGHSVIRTHTAEVVALVDPFLIGLTAGA